MIIPWGTILFLVSYRMLLDVELKNCLRGKNMIGEGDLIMPSGDPIKPPNVASDNLVHPRLSPPTQFPRWHLFLSRLVEGLTSRILWHTIYLPNARAALYDAKGDPNLAIALIAKRFEGSVGFPSHSLLFAALYYWDLPPVKQLWGNNEYPTRV